MKKIRAGFFLRQSTRSGSFLKELPIFRRLLFLLAPLLSAETWKEYHAGPVSVLAVGMDKEASETLNALDQYRYTLGQLLGAPLDPVWPIKVVLLKDKQASTKPQLFALRRDSYMAVLPSGLPAEPRLYPSYGRILLDDGISGITLEVEEAILTLFSTLEVDGVKVTLGALPEKKLQTRAWARLHLLAVDPRYSGKLRVMLTNMRKGVEQDVALRNAFEITPAAFEKEVDAYMAAPITGTVKLSGHAVEVRRSGLGRELNPPVGELALVDLEPTELGYKAILEKFPQSSEANEGLGLLMNDKAILGKSQGARAQTALGTYESLRNAAGKSPKWGEPAKRLAELEPDTGRKLILMKKYTELVPRDWQYWGKYAQTLQDAEKFPESARAWLMAEKSAPNSEIRQQLRDGRRMSVEQRLELEAAARRKEQEEKRLELERLKNEAIARVREAEAKANKGFAPMDTSKLEQWWDGTQADAHITGKLERVDCMKGLVRVVIRGPDNKLIQLGAPDMSKIGLLGAATLSCGIQRPIRNATIDYVNKPNKPRQTSGDIVRVELQ